MSLLKPTPYPDLNEVLIDLVESVAATLGSDFVGAYLQGSFAIGDFDQNSDVDFIVVLKKEISDQQVDALQEIHKRVYQKTSPWAQHLEGSYIPADILKDWHYSGKEVWYVDHGSIKVIRSNHCNSAVVRWALRERGITLKGPSPKSLIDPIPVDVLRKEIFTTMNDWGREILAHPEEWANYFYQTFIVLNYCRMLYDLKTGENHSKRAGAEWAKQNLDSVWRDLIDRSWGGRFDPAKTVKQPADPIDYARTLQFLEYVMHESRKYFQG